MPINREISLEYRSKMKNGNDYTSNPSDFAVNLLGNAMASVQATIQVTVDWYANADSVDTWNVKATTIQRTVGNFSDDGFFAGQKFAYVSGWNADNTTPIDFEATIDSISADGSLLTFTVTLGAVTPDATASDVGIRAIGNAPENVLTGVLYRFGLIQNTEPFNTTSKIAGVDNRYQAKSVGLGGSTTPVNMEAQGTVLTWQTGSATAAFVSNSQFAQVYEIVHDFIINPWYLQGQTENIQNNNAPEYFSGNRCLKHAFEVELRPVISNPNQAIIFRVDDSNGFTGWFNENFNGEPSNYAISNVFHIDTATSNPVDSIQPDNRTTTVIVIDHLSGNFAVGNNAGVFLSYLPAQSEYLTGSETAVDAFLYDSLYHNEGTAPVTGTGIIKSITSTSTGPQLTITIETEYTSAQTDIVSGNLYLLAVDISDLALSNQDSDAVSLVAELTNYEGLRNIDGLLTFTRFNTLVYDETAGVDTGTLTINAWNQDDIIVDFAFDLDLAKNAFLNDLVFRLVAYNTVEDIYFELDSYVIDTSNAIRVSRAQQIEVDESRGYILASGNQFNDVFITTGLRVGGMVSYSGFFAQKIKWQDWLINRIADTVFYDSAEPSNNLNYKSSNYSGLNDYEIRLICEANLTGSENGIDGIGFVTGSTGNLTVYNYGVAVDGWTAVMTLHDPDTDANTSGVILTDKDTVFRVTWENTTQGNDLSGLFALHRIQQSLSAGDDIQQLSNIRTPADNIILKPLTGETLLKVSQLAPDSVVTECLIDKDKVNAGVSYNLSFELQRK